MLCRRLVRRFPLWIGCLTILLASGCFGPGGLPIALFAMAPESGDSPLVVTFDASASFDPDGAIVRYDWTFGDGAAGVGPSPVHTYAVESEKAFTVRLTVTDHDGNQASSEQLLTVHPPPPPPNATRVEFAWPFHYDADGDDAVNLNDEYFTLENTGAAPADLSGWMVSNERGAIFRFPDGYVLAVGAVVFVHSGAGVNTSSILYWNADGPIWNDHSDIAVLYDASGLIIDIYAYVSC